MSIIYANGVSTITVLFWFKIGTLAMIYSAISSYKRKEFYYYKNLGVSKLTLWVPTLSFDFILFLFLIILTAKIR
jgi:hypothetical protein